MSNPGGAPGSSQNNGPVKFSKKAGVVDTAELIEKQARYDADVAMTESKEDRDAGKLKRWWNRTWKHNLAEPYYREKKYLESLKKIHASKNRLINEEGGSQKGTDDANDAIINRFMDDRKAEMLRDGEKSSKIVGNAQINKLVKDFATGAIDETAFAAQKKSILGTLNSDYTNNEQLYVDNLLKVAQEIKDAANHGQKLADFDVDVELTLGKAKDRLFTEAHKEGFPKIWDKFKKTRVGGLLASEVGASLVGAGVYAAINKLGTSVFRSKIAKWATFGGTGLLAGLIAGHKESKRLKKDRAFDSMERAKGKKFEGDMKRRNEMEKYVYKTRGAKEIISNLSIDLSKVKAGNLSPADLQTVLKNLADLESRMKLGKDRKIDLVTYSRFDQSDIESFKIEDLRADLKFALRNQNPNFDQELNTLTTSQMQTLLGEQGGIEKQDSDFKKHRRLESFKKGAKTALFGAALGFLAQETFNTILPTNTDSVISETAKHTAGMAKGWVNGKGVFGGWNSDDIGLHEKTTPTLGLFRWMAGEHAHIPAADLHDYHLGHENLKLPPGVDVHPNGDGTFAFVKDGQPIEDMDHLKLLDDNGNVDTELLRSHCIGTTQILTGGVVTGTAKEYVDTHPHFEKIHYGKWNENGTVISDHNEIRTHWAGVDANGNPILTINKMTSDGSWHQLADGTKDSVDAQAIIKSGKAEMLCAMSRNTQFNVLRIPIDVHGNPVPPLDKIAEYKEFFEHDANGHLVFRDAHNNIVPEGKGGHPVFLGKYGTMAYQTGVAADGKPIFAALSTIVGHGRDTLSVDTTVSNIRIDLPNDIEVPLFMHAGNRQPLERGENSEVIAGQIEQTTSLSVPYGYYYSGNSGNGRPKKYFSNWQNFRNSNGSVHNLISLIQSRNTLGAITIPANAVSGIANPSATGSYKKLNNKKSFSNWQNFRNSSSSINNLVSGAQLNSGPSDNTKNYDYVFDYLETLENYKTSSNEKQKKLIEYRHGAYNRRYDEKLNLEDFILFEKGRIERQIENIAIEDSNVGDKPFSPEFYQTAPMIKGIENADEIAVFLDSTAIGDAVMMLPIIDSLHKYIEINKLKKDIVFVSSQKNLFKSFAEQYNNVKILSLAESKTYFEGSKSTKRYIINTDKTFEDYEQLGLSDTDVANPEKVLSIDWSSWKSGDKEEYPVAEGKTIKYDMMPARAARRFEIMLGQKLYDDINAIDHYIEKNKNFDTESQEISTKYNIKSGEEVMLISAGSSNTVKEYQPEKWKEVIEGIFAKNPNAHILFLDDPDTTRRKKYGDMLDPLIAAGAKISRVSEPISKMNTIMGMSEYVITPDTGLGHYAGAMGRKNIMLILGDPVLWSTPGTKRIMHKKAHELYKRGISMFHPAWSAEAAGKYFTEDENGVLVGASDIDPKEILKAIEKYQLLNTNP